MKDYVCYPAILKEEKGKFKLSFIDLGIEVEAFNVKEVIKAGKETLGTYLIELDELPKVSELKDIKENEKIIYVDVNLKWYDEKLKYKSVTRAVTLPYYLNEKVKESGINVSAVLQEALVNKLAEED